MWPKFSDEFCEDSGGSYLREVGLLALLVLRDLVRGVLAAFAGAERLAALRDVDHLVRERF